MQPPDPKQHRRALDAQRYRARQGRSSAALVSPDAGLCSLPAAAPRGRRTLGAVDVGKQTAELSPRSSSRLSAGVGRARRLRSSSMPFLQTPKHPASCGVWGDVLLPPRVRPTACRALGGANIPTKTSCTLSWAAWGASIPLTSGVPHTPREEHRSPSTTRWVLRPSTDPVWSPDPIQSSDIIWSPDPTCSPVPIWNPDPFCSPNSVQTSNTTRSPVPTGSPGPIWGPQLLCGDRGCLPSPPHSFSSPTPHLSPSPAFFQTKENRISIAVCTELDVPQPCDPRDVRGPSMTSEEGSREWDGATGSGCGGSTGRGGDAAGTGGGPGGTR